jgi:hypothetical protein
MKAYHVPDEKGAAPATGRVSTPGRARPRPSSTEQQPGLFDHLRSADQLVVQAWATYRCEPGNPLHPDLVGTPAVIAFWHFDRGELALVEQSSDVAARLRALKRDVDGAFVVIGYRLAAIVGVLREEDPKRASELKESMVKALLPTINRAYRAAWE